jgi:hypothetical protein
VILVPWKPVVVIWLMLSALVLAGYVASRLMESKAVQSASVESMVSTAGPGTGRRSAALNARANVSRVREDSELPRGRKTSHS